MPVYSQPAINNLDDFIFGVSPNPVKLKNGLSIGGGQVYPELNFTLPFMEVNANTMPEVEAQYKQMITEACARAVELHAPGLVVEFELLPDLTIEPKWGETVTRILRATLDEAQAKHGLLVGLRVTPNDVREFERPQLTRQGYFVDQMFKSFELCAEAGADMLSIESTGGKEVHDDAILQGDLPMSVFALGVLASRDMAFLWERIVAISHAYGAVPAGDSACGFANTAMVLAENRYIPRVWSAVIRVMSVARSLVAFEQGALGPSKDCAYEGVYLKAITGCPIALEGAEAACAHLSPIGNITKAVPDLWSNESVQNLKLLGAMAPTVSVEQLIYATRLMNVASSHGRHSA
jgi:methanol---5-hydroxybenzimidazolylcobamide Co-methyltransferase